MNAFLEKHKNEEPVPEFSVSDHFISDFKKRNHLSSLTVHLQRWTDPNQERNYQWETTIHNLLTNFTRDHILNCDETSWQVFPSRLKTWAQKGSHSVHIHVNGNVKESITSSHRWYKMSSLSHCTWWYMWKKSIGRFSASLYKSFT